jgi:phage repressor protein C with HTH and peptisase S24 domain
MGGLAGKFSAPLDRRYVISAEPDPDLVELDYVDLRFGLGGSYVDGPVTVEKQQFSRGWLEQITRSPPELLFWAETDGDSMEPTIRSGEIILGDRSQTTPRFGDGIWAIALGEIGMIKRLRPLPNGNVEIHSDNPVVPPAIAADGEMHVIGRVVAVVRRL